MLWNDVLIIFISIPYWVSSILFMVFAFCSCARCGVSLTSPRPSGICLFAWHCAHVHDVNRALLGNNIARPPLSFPFYVWLTTIHAAFLAFCSRARCNCLLYSSFFRCLLVRLALCSCSWCETSFIPPLICLYNSSAILHFLLHVSCNIVLDLFPFIEFSIHVVLPHVTACFVSLRFISDLANRHFRVHHAFFTWSCPHFPSRLQCGIACKSLNLGHPIVLH